MEKPDIRTVIYLDVPYSPEAYLQETGRDGAPVEAMLLCSAEDLCFANALSASSGNSLVDSRQAETSDPLAAERYAQMLGYVLDMDRCRREQLLGFLGQEPVSCSGCDVCDGRVLRRAEEEAEILELISRNRRRFTLLQATQLLRGAKSYEVMRRGLAAYYGFGTLAGWQEEEIEEALEMLRRRRAVKVLKRGPWRERITLIR
jgi:ATP-dependent DNA helicase RecQ